MSERERAREHAGGWAGGQGRLSLATRAEQHRSLLPSCTFPFLPRPGSVPHREALLGSSHEALDL